jgi:hypothetical protein
VGPARPVIEQRPNAGKGAALRAGFRRALDAGYDAVLTLDADGQHDPDEIPSFLAAFTTEPPPDLVIGSRNFRAMPPIRRLSNTIGGKAFSWAVGREIADNQSGYRLIGRRILEATLDSDERGFEFEVEMITTCIRLGGTIAWVPIRTIYAGAPIAHQAGRPPPELHPITRKARRDVRGPLGRLIPVLPDRSHRSIPASKGLDGSRNSSIDRCHRSDAGRSPSAPGDTVRLRFDCW